VIFLAHEEHPFIEDDHILAIKYQEPTVTLLYLFGDKLPSSAIKTEKYHTDALLLLSML
jgi:hypothetical protein